MIRDHLILTLNKTVEKLVSQGALPPSVEEVAVEIDVPKDPAHGDFATNFALVSSKAAKQNPRATAESLATALRENQDLFQAIEIAGPGFINFRLQPTWIANFVEKINTNPGFYKPAHHGSEAHDSEARDAAKPHRDSPTLKVRPQRINVEFVSVNPNGPITIGSGRGAAFGSALCNLLEAAGNTVHREYYINDGVNSEQMRLFAESVRAIVHDQPVPDNGYKGDYVHDVAHRLKSHQEPWIKFFEERMRSIDQEYRYLESDTEQWMPMNFGMPEYLGKFGQEQFENVKERNAVRGEFLMKAKNAAYDAINALNADQESEPLDILKNLNYEPTLLDWQQLSQAMMLAKQKTDLAKFEVLFDTWFSEQSLHNSGQVVAELGHLMEIGTADTTPQRTKLITGKGGVIKEVQIEDQPVNTTDDDDPQGQHDAQAHDAQAQDAPAQDTEATLWLRSTKFGDDQDRVLRRSDGRLTYIASDVAYHKDKFNRPENADKLITVLGPDHHGYIGRLQAVVAAMILDDQQVQALANSPDSEAHDPQGHDDFTTRKPLDEFDTKIYESPEERDLCQAALQVAKQRLEVQIFQIVRFMKDGKPAPMRKRDGNIYALIDLINEIGATLKPDGTQEEKQQAGSDVARFFYLMRHHDTAMDFDLELATKQSDENPVFYVQYAHARICSILEKSKGNNEAQDVAKLHRDSEALDAAKPQGASEAGDTVNLSLLTHDREKALIIKLCDLPNEVARTAEDYAVNRLTTYATELARTYHHFYDACRVIQPDQPELTKARLALCQATKTTLAQTLKLLGISAPERM